jgi:hypothetical protein
MSNGINVGDVVNHAETENDSDQDTGNSGSSCLGSWIGLIVSILILWFAVYTAKDLYYCIVKLNVKIIGGIGLLTLLCVGGFWFYISLVELINEEK